MTELMSKGIELMLLGMGIVYLFLTMLVVVINIMSALVQRFFPEPSQVTVTIPTVATGIDKSTIAAISAAVHAYRHKYKTHQ
ncbi:MAG: OadG family transporter subunit [Methylococcaceae bacterium]